MVQVWDEDLPLLRPRAKDDTTKDDARSKSIQDLRLPNRALFGLVLGSSCGVAYALVDSFRTAEGRRPENMGRALTRARDMSVLFGGYFAAFQSIKALCVLSREKHDLWNTCFATAVTTAPLLVSTTMRKSVPHLMLLVGIDAINESGIMKH